MSLRARASTLGALVALMPAPAEAVCAEQRTGPTVELASLPQGLRSVAGRFAALLERDLAARGIGLCAAADALAPAASSVATLALTWEATTTVRIAVRDLVTSKRVSRDLDMVDIPADGRALVLAIAADELLRASWVELALRTAATKDRAVPPAVANAIATVTQAPPRRDRSFGAAFALDQHRGQPVQLGLETWLSARLVPSLHVAGRAGARRTVPVTGADGNVEMLIASGGLGFAVPVLRLGAAGELAAIARADASHVWFRARADPGAMAVPADGWAVTTSGGAALSLRFDARAVVTFEAVAGGTPLPILATDEGADVVGVAGAMFAFRVGLGLGF